MLELTEFPYLPTGDPGRAVGALIYACRAMPPGGEPLRLFRRRMKEQRLWDNNRIKGTFAFLGMKEAESIEPSEFVHALVAQKTESKARDLLTLRMWDTNALLFKYIIELLKERVYSRDDVIKYIDSVAYPGSKPLRPQLEGWLHMALGLDVLKLVGIALDLGARGKAYLDQAAVLDVEELLEDVALARDAHQDQPAAVRLSDDDDDSAAENAAAASPAGSATAESQDSSGAAPAAPEHDQDHACAAGDASPHADVAASRQPSGEPAPESAMTAVAPLPVAPANLAPGAAAARVAPAAQAVPAAHPRMSDLVDVSALASPQGRGRPVAVTEFAGKGLFSDDTLDETGRRMQAWWSEQSARRMVATVTDFDFKLTQWVDASEEMLYRVAVAAALVFRLGGDRAAVRQAFASLDQADVLDDLYHGTVPDVLPERVDPKALMLASLVARRCAESPELAITLEKQSSAAEVFAVLDQALGRGLLKIELFWMMGALYELGAVHFEDMANFTALPHRPVRDTLFRLGFLDSPYAHDALAMLPAARAARRAAGSAGPPDEVLMGFALAAGCAYDCSHRRRCEYACRERAE